MQGFIKRGSTLFLFSFLIIVTVSAQESILDTLWKEGIQFMIDGDYFQAAEKMSEYSSYHPMSPAVYSNLGICYYNLGDDERACENWTNARLFGAKGNTRAYNFWCDYDYKVEMLQKFYYKGKELNPNAAYRPYYSRADSLRGALRPERTCFDVDYYDLTVRIIPWKKSIEGKNEIWFRGVEPSARIQIDLFENMEISSISMEGKELSFFREYNAVFIELPEKIKAGGKYRLLIEYSGSPRKAPNAPWEGGFVWARDKNKNRWVGVACEQYGASSWWPVKDHLSDRPDSMSIRMEVPSRFQAISNGRLRGIEELKKGYSRYNWHVSYPINSYNATFYMGKYVEFTDTIQWHDSLLIARYHVMPYNLELAKSHFQQAKDVVKFYNDAFGPFPFWNDDFRMVESPYEGMEHQTAIAYGNAFSNEENSKEYLSKKFDYIIVHEAAHEWWGNSVTAIDFADVWLHEGFATYAEYLFIEHMLGKEEALKEVQHHLPYIMNMWPMVQNRNVNEDAFASGDVYTKGAALLHSLRATIDNDSLFRDILREFNLQYRYRISTSQDFIDFVNRKCGKDFSAFFNKYLYDVELPVLSYSYEREGENILFRYKWTGVEVGFEMPFSIKILGTDEAIRLYATTNEKEIELENAESFLFYNYRTPPDGCPENGLTYYATHLTTSEN